MSADKNSAKFRLREMLMLILAGVAVFLMIALVTYSSSDGFWPSGSVMNAGGKIGAWGAYMFFAAFGAFAFLAPVVVWYWIFGKTTYRF